MEFMARGGSAPYPRELREQAVRLVREWRRQHGRTDGGLTEVGEQLGVHHETVRNWLRQAEVDSGDRPGASSEEKARIKELERENAELRRGNEILKSAAAFFGAELTPAEAAFLDEMPPPVIEVSTLEAGSCIKISVFGSESRIGWEGTEEDAVECVLGSVESAAANVSDGYWMSGGWQTRTSSRPT
jgi:transposase-like protein